jgi:hypothetical protein
MVSTEIVVAACDPKVAVAAVTDFVDQFANLYVWDAQTRRPLWKVEIDAGIEEISIWEDCIVLAGIRPGDGAARSATIERYNFQGERLIQLDFAAADENNLPLLRTHADALFVAWGDEIVRFESDQITARYRIPKIRGLQATIEAFATDDVGDCFAAIRRWEPHPRRSVLNRLLYDSRRFAGWHIVKLDRNLQPQTESRVPTPDRTEAVVFVPEAKVRCLAYRGAETFTDVVGFEDTLPDSGQTIRIDGFAAKIAVATSEHSVAMAGHLNPNEAVAVTVDTLTGAVAWTDLEPIIGIGRAIWLYKDTGVVYALAQPGFVSRSSLQDISYLNLKTLSISDRYEFF